MSAQQKAVYIMEQVTKATGWLAELLILAIAFFVFINAASRFLGFTLPWLFDLTTFGMVMMTFIGAGYALRENAHVRVDIVRTLLSQDICNLMDIFTYLLCIAFFFVLGWEGFEWVLDNYQFGVVSATSVLKMPMWIVTAAIPVGCFLLLLQAVTDLVKIFGGLSKSSFMNIPVKHLSVLIISILVLSIISVWAFYNLNPLFAMLIFVLFILFAGVPVAFALGLTGSLGLYFFLGSSQLTQLPILTFQAINSWPLTAAPLFILGGMLMTKAKIAEKLFQFIEAFFVYIPSPLLIATVLSGGVFCAITGSSVAATAAIATICLPLLFSKGYNKKVAVGVVAGSTVGTLIPPSNGFILFGILTDESIGQLFMAGIGPSIILFSLYILYIVGRGVFMGEKEQEPAKAISRRERSARIKSGFWGIVAPIIILGGIYLGVFTPTEAGAVLVVYALFVGVLISREIKWTELKQATTSSTRMSLMILSIVAGASIYGAVITQNQLINVLIEKCQALQITAPIFLLIVLCILIILGMFMESVSIMMITLPITFPIALAMGINPLWYGVFYIISSEVGLLTPPVGLNLFVLQNVTNQKQSFIIKATFPFLLMMILSLVIIYFIPGIVTWIPSTMFVK